MKNKKLCIITGVSGELGKALCETFAKGGFQIYGIDLLKPADIPEMEFFECDLHKICFNENKKKILFDSINNWKGSSNINVLINNAAYQFIGTKHPNNIHEFNRTLNVNLIAPYIMISHLAKDLEDSKGSVVNISSIHAKLTKPGFSFYSSSKAALSMLTKSLAIDFGDKFRINCIEPAAINTKMLRNGFKNNISKIEKLATYHPQNKIANPSEVAELAFKISMSEIEFLHGSCIDMSGAISSRLHDPE